MKKIKSNVIAMCIEQASKQKKVYNGSHGHAFILIDLIRYLKSNTEKSKSLQNNSNDAMCNRLAHEYTQYTYYTEHISMKTVLYTTDYMHNSNNNLLQWNGISHFFYFIIIIIRNKNVRLFGRYSVDSFHFEI